MEEERERERERRVRGSRAVLDVSGLSGRR